MDIGILDRHAAEGNDQLAAAFDRVPGDALSVEAVVRTEHMRNDDHRRARTVGIERSDISAEHVEEAVDLALGMMKPPCAGPAIRAAENGPRSGFGVNTAKLVGNKIERFRPADLDITVAPTFPGVFGPAFKPAAPDGRAGCGRGYERLRAGCRAGEMGGGRRDADGFRGLRPDAVHRMRPNESC
ncbi:hypothetical protein ACVJBD_006063 [Rhizobium mongolense]